MEMLNTTSKKNVNRSSSDEVAVAPGRYTHDQQVGSDRNQATAGRSPGHAKQVSESRSATSATVRTGKN